MQGRLSISVTGKLHINTLLVLQKTVFKFVYVNLLTPYTLGSSFVQEEFEDTKWVIRIRKSKDRQHNGQTKKDKMTNNDLQNIHTKLKIEKHEPH